MNRLPVDWLDWVFWKVCLVLIGLAGVLIQSEFLKKKFLFKETWISGDGDSWPAGCTVRTPIVGTDISEVPQYGAVNTRI